MPRVREAPGANAKRVVGLWGEVSLLSGCGSGAATVWEMLKMLASTGGWVEETSRIRYSRHLLVLYDTGSAFQRVGATK